MIQAAGLYAVGAWVVVQVGVAVFPVLLFPRWALQVLVIVAILGFPVSVVLAWAYDVTPTGLRRVDRSEELDDDGVPVVLVPTWLRLVLVLVVIGGTGAVGWWAWTGWLKPRAGVTATAGSEAGGELDPSRVAVLYFDDLSSGGELQYLADGLTDAVNHELAQIPTLAVVSRNGVKPFRETSLFPDSIARRLGVGTLVEGSIDRTEDGLVAGVQLVNGNTGRTLMSRRIRVRGANHLLLRDTIVAEAARYLGRRLGQELQLRSLRDDTDSPEAWELYLRAKERLESARELRWAGGDAGASRRMLGEADDLLARAEDEDDEWIRPVVMRGEVALQAAGLVLNRMDNDRTLLEEAMAHAERAIEREPRHGPALALRGKVRAEMSWIAHGTEADTLLQAAEADLLRSVEVEPSNAEAWVELAHLRRRAGDFAGARVAASQALEADPFLINAENDVLLAQALVWLELGEQERARRWLATGRSRYPDELQFLAGELLRLAGGPAAILPPSPADSAWDLVEAIEARSGGQWSYGRLQVAAVLAVSGRADSARTVLEALGPPGPEDAWYRYYEALVRLHLGERERALDLLDQFLALRPERRSYIASEWWWRPLHDEVRFREVVGSE